MTLLDEARDLIKAYLAGKPHLSIVSMAKSCGMAPSTARSIVQGEVKKTSIENIVSLLSTFMSYEEIYALVEKYEKNKLKSGSLRIWFEKGAKAISSEGFDWEDPDHEIAALASSSFGTSRDRVAKMFGASRGLGRLDAMLNAGILREVNGRIKQQAEYVSYSIKDSQKKAALQSDRWKTEDIDKGGFVYHLTQNYTEEGHKEALAIIGETVVRLAALEEKYAGGDKVLMLSIVGNLLNGSDA
jgi:hypothetical protein